MTKIDQVEKDIKILVVDDNQMTRGMVKSIMKGVGFQNVMTADSGKMAFETIEKEAADLVICDWNMPNGTGLDLLRELRSHEYYKELPFIMLTAEVYKENITEALKAGVSDYIAKPFTAETLISKVAGVLLRKRKKAQPE